MWFIKSVILLIGVIAVLWLGMKNADQTVDFSLFTRYFENLSLNLLLVVVFITGMVFSFLIAVVNEFGLRSTIGSQRRHISRLEKELAAIRNLPLEETEGRSDETELDF